MGGKEPSVTPRLTDETDGRPRDSEECQTWTSLHACLGLAWDGMGGHCWNSSICLVVERIATAHLCASVLLATTELHSEESAGNYQTTISQAAE
jgi:hypothetical protein